MYIEDYIAILPTLKIDKQDEKLIKSISLQIARNIGLTDRQFELIKSKLINYKDLFPTDKIIDFHTNINRLKIPLRQIDRSKTIKIVTKEILDLFSVEEKLMIAIRFPYTNKMIKYINFIKTLDDNSFYDKNTKTHFVSFNEKNVFEVVKKFQNANFDFDKDIINFYKILDKFNSAPETYKPGIYNLELKNLHPNCVNYSLKHLGKPSIDNLSLYYDKRDALGLSYFDKDDLAKSLNKLTLLAREVAIAENNKFFINSAMHTVEDLILMIFSLKKTPTLVILDNDDATYYLSEICKILEKHISLKNVSVLFRFDNTTDEKISFNKLIKDLQLNNPIDANTQFVFLQAEKIPKPLLLSNWKPDTTIITGNITPSRTAKLYWEQSKSLIHYAEINIFMSVRYKNHVTSI